MQRANGCGAERPVEAVKVCWGVTQRSYMEQQAQDGMSRTLQVVCAVRCGGLSAVAGGVE